MYHGMVVLPWDTILCIVECCSLESRYVIMMCCKALSNIDWSRFCEHYRLPERTKYALRQLITRDYCVNWSLSRRQNFVWCRCIAIEHYLFGHQGQNYGVMALVLLHYILKSIGLLILFGM